MAFQCTCTAFPDDWGSQPTEDEGTDEILAITGKAELLLPHELRLLHFVHDALFEGDLDAARRHGVGHQESKRTLRYALLHVRR